MNLIFVVKGNLENQTPIINQLKCAIKLHLNSKVICTNCEERLKKQFESEGIQILLTNHKTIRLPIFRRVTDWIGFRFGTYKLLKNNYTNEFLYIGSVDTALSLGRKLLNYKYIFHISELYDKFPHYLYFMKKYAQKSILNIVPEFCRAKILINWMDLKKTPIVIPNKPFDDLRTQNTIIENDEIRSTIKKIDDKKIVIYQGQIYKERNIFEVALALEKMKDDKYVLLLMGNNYENMVEEIKKLYHNTIYIGFVPAPFHLQITRHAHIGIVAYDDSSLNNIFCAPNKIYEYGAFGIPMLARDNPGLRYSVGYYEAGICTNFNCVDDIINAIEKIEINYNEYSKNALKLYKSHDLENSFREIIKECENNLLKR